MTERAWELYRLSVVALMPESPYKLATIAAIQHKLHQLDVQDRQRWFQAYTTFG